MPGGRIEFKETPENALQRECEEELGLKNVTVGDIVDAWSFSVAADNIDYHFILLIYECFTDQIKFKLSDEHAEYAWVSLENIKDLNMREGYKNTIKKYQTAKNT